MDHVHGEGVLVSEGRDFVEVVPHGDIHRKECVVVKEETIVTRIILEGAEEKGDRIVLCLIEYYSAVQTDRQTDRQTM